MQTSLPIWIQDTSCSVGNSKLPSHYNTQIVRNQLVNNSFYLQHVTKDTRWKTAKWANIFLKASVCNKLQICSWSRVFMKLWEVLAIKKTRTCWREGGVYTSALDSPAILEIGVCLPGGSYDNCRSRDTAKKKSEFQFTIYSPLISWLVGLVHNPLSPIFNSQKPCWYTDTFCPSRKLKISTWDFQDVFQQIKDNINSTWNKSHIERYHSHFSEWQPDILYHPELKTELKNPLSYTQDMKEAGMISEILPLKTQFSFSVWRPSASLILLIFTISPERPKN